MHTRVVVLGAGFGGLELSTMLSEAFEDAIDVVLIDKGDSFVFGFSKLDVMFGRQMPANARHAYKDIVKPGVRFVQTTVRSFDPSSRSVVTDAGTFEGDILVVALGADLEPEAVGHGRSIPLDDDVHHVLRRKRGAARRPAVYQSIATGREEHDRL